VNFKIKVTNSLVPAIAWLFNIAFTIYTSVDKKRTKKRSYRIYTLKMSHDCQYLGM